MAAGTEKANMWHGRGNSGGSWPPAFPCSSWAPKTNCLRYIMVHHFELFIVFSKISHFRGKIGFLFGKNKFSSLH